MKRVNGVIVEATEEELKQAYALSNWNKVTSFSQFKEIMIEEGCKIVCDYQTSASAQTVQSTTSEQEKIVKENVKPTNEMKETVTDLETNQQQTNSVTTVHTETVATMPQQTESGVEKMTNQETQSEKTLTNTEHRSKPVIIINKKKEN